MVVCGLCHYIISPQVILGPGNRSSNRLKQNKPSSKVEDDERVSKKQRGDADTEDTKKDPTIIYTLETKTKNRTSFLHNYHLLVNSSLDKATGTTDHKFLQVPFSSPNELNKRLVMLKDIDHCNAHREDAEGGPQIYKSYLDKVLNMSVPQQKHLEDQYTNILLVEVLEYSITEGTRRPLLNHYINSFALGNLSIEKKNPQTLFILW